MIPFGGVCSVRGAFARGGPQAGVYDMVGVWPVGLDRVYPSSPGPKCVHSWVMWAVGVVLYVLVGHVSFWSIRNCNAGRWPVDMSNGRGK